MDSFELLMVIVVISLTSVLVVVGVQVFLLVRALRKILDSIKALLDKSPDSFRELLEEIRNKRK